MFFGIFPLFLLCLRKLIILMSEEIRFFCVAALRSGCRPHSARLDQAIRICGKKRAFRHLTAEWRMRHLIMSIMAILRRIRGGAINEVLTNKLGYNQIATRRFLPHGWWWPRWLSRRDGPLVDTAYGRLHHLRPTAQQLSRLAVELLPEKKQQSLAKKQQSLPEKKTAVVFFLRTACMLGIKNIVLSVTRSFF